MGRVCVSEDFEDEIYDYEAIFKKFAFGRCRRCEGPANGIVIGDHILWALCCNCGTASWAMVSFDGWGKPETRFRQQLAEAARWDIGDEDEAFAGSGWDLGGERQGAYITGTRGERAFSLTSILVAFGTAATVGLVFGLFPARQAAQMDPVQALRFE